MKDKTKLEDYSYLWDGTQPEHVLERFPSGVIDKEEAYLIVDTKSDTYLIIEDDDLCREVKRKMLQNSVRVIDATKGQKKN